MRLAQLEFGIYMYRFGSLTVVSIMDPLFKKKA